MRLRASGTTGHEGREQRNSQALQSIIDRLSRKKFGEISAVYSRIEDGRTDIFRDEDAQSATVIDSTKMRLDR